MAISRSLRFKIFTRDGFTCMYCGAQPPSVVLEVDHVIAQSKGGTDDPSNLITACFDCNRAKHAHGISEGLVLREILRENNANFKEKAAEALVQADLVDYWIENYTGMWGGL